MLRYRAKILHVNVLEMFQDFNFPTLNRNVLTIEVLYIEVRLYATLIKNGFCLKQTFKLNEKLIRTLFTIQIFLNNFLNYFIWTIVVVIEN